MLKVFTRFTLIHSLIYFDTIMVRSLILEVKVPEVIFFFQILSIVFILIGSVDLGEMLHSVSMLFAKLSVYVIGHLSQNHLYLCTGRLSYHLLLKYQILIT